MNPINKFLSHGNIYVDIILIIFAVQVEPMAVEEAPVSEWREPVAAVSAPAPAFSEQAAAAPPQPQHWKSPEPAPAPAQEIAQVRCSGVIKQ